MSSQEAFGLNLRRARRHRGISLDHIAAQTNVSVDFWEDLESNDFSRWPSGIYARTWIRAYAQLIGVDPNKTVDEFCRWFPQGDRRVQRVIERQARIIGHELDWIDDLVPVDGDRRASAPPPLPSETTAAQARNIRLLAAAFDLGAVGVIVLTVGMVLRTGRWPILAVVATLYHVISLALLGCTPAVWAVGNYLSGRPEFRRRGESVAFRGLKTARR